MGISQMIYQHVNSTEEHYKDIKPWIFYALQLYTCMITQTCGY